MGTSYSAFGLTLRPSFPLPGMTRADDTDLPTLRLDLESKDELLTNWHGVEGAGAWRGMLSDGNELVIERGESGGLLFSYGQLAQFRFDPEAGRLCCSPSQLAALEWQRVLLNRVLPHVSLAFGREALHAAAVQTPVGVVAIAAPGGAGKSTLAAAMVRRGHRFFCDDILVLAGGEGAVEAHPGAPHMSLDAPGEAGGVALLPKSGSTLAILDGERWVTVGEHVVGRPDKVAAVVLLERGDGLALEARPLPTTPLTLVPFMLGLPDDEGRDAGRFALYSDLVDSTALLCLSGDSGDRPEDLAEVLEGAIGLAAPVAGGGVV
jgi:hypothetical protein